MNLDKAITTMTLNDIVQYYPDVLDFMVLDIPEHTEKFKLIFMAQWNYHEVNYDTVDLFKRRCSDYFTKWKDYYIKLINLYDAQIQELAGIVETEHSDGTTTDVRDEDSSATTTYGATSDSTFYDLPNGAGDGYPTNKSSGSTGGSDTLAKQYNTNNNISRKADRTLSKVNVVEQRELAYKNMHNIMLEFSEKFAPCFCKVYL